jgi:hypothetical protein
MNNKRKVYISSSQYGMLKESEWNFHFGKEHNGEPYYSDNKFQMFGRETGHFGSGTYFSTYRDIKDIDNCYHAKEEELGLCPLSVTEKPSGKRQSKQLISVTKNSEYVFNPSKKFSFDDKDKEPC